jgi:hypothetical protein
LLVTRFSVSEEIEPALVKMEISLMFEVNAAVNSMLE